MKNKRNWVIAVILAVVGFTAAQIQATPDVNSAANVETAPREVCAYQWAYRDAPELTKKISALIREFDSKATARARLYGEDCVYADGRADFTVMETDFYFTLPVEDLTDEEALGLWLARAMQAVTQIPREEIQGKDGFVECWFEKSEAERVILRVPIQKYKDESRGKSGVELYRMFSP